MTVDCVSSLGSAASPSVASDLREPLADSDPDEMLSALKSYATRETRHLRYQ